MPKQPQFTLEDVNRTLARKLYWQYVKYVHEGRWIPAKHLLFLCDKVQSFLEDKLISSSGQPAKILIIQLPPQHGKSQSITETLPSWYLGKNPNKRVIEVSYSEDLAQVFGRRNKEKIEKFGLTLFNIKISKKTRSETEFEIDSAVGSMISRGILSGITGRPGDLIIIDDPIKNRQEADSETYRNRIWDEWLNSIRTRRSATAKVIVIMTRWHEDDLAGRLQSGEDKDTVYTINLPCEAEENDILGREIGQSLFPEIGKNDEWLQAEKRGYISKEGTRAWNALFQGRPTSIQGNMVKRGWWQYYKELPASLDEFTIVIQSWDMSFKDSDGTDPVAGHIWGLWKANRYLIDRVHGRMDFPTTKQSVRNLTYKWPMTNQYFKVVEDKANGSAIIADLKSEIGGFIEFPPKGMGNVSKESMVSMVSPTIEAGNVYLPDPSIAPWVNDIVEEFASFPNGAHDDDVDASTHALYFLAKYVTEEPPKTEKDLLAEKWGIHSPEYRIHSQALYDKDNREFVTLEELGL